MRDVKRAHVVLCMIIAAASLYACGGARGLRPHGPPPEYEEPESTSDAGVSASDASGD